MTACLARAWLLLGLCAGAAQAAAAQGLADPTRPPNVAAAPAGVDAEPELPSNQLQSVLISSTRKIAVINGQSVALGGKLGDAVLARISETEVVLKYPDRTEVLKLLGGIERQPARSARKPGAGK